MRLRKRSNKSDNLLFIGLMYRIHYMVEVRRGEPSPNEFAARRCVSTWEVICQRTEEAHQRALSAEKPDAQRFLEAVYFDETGQRFDSVFTQACGPQSFRDYLPVEARNNGLFAPFKPSRDFPTEWLGINIDQEDYGVFDERGAKRCMTRHIALIQPSRIEDMQKVLNLQRLLRGPHGTVMTFEFDPDTRANDKSSIQRALETKKARLKRFIFDFEEYYGEPFYLPDNLSVLVDPEQIPGLTEHLKGQFSQHIPDLTDYMP